MACRFHSMGEFAYAAAVRSGDAELRKAKPGLIDEKCFRRFGLSIYSRNARQKR